jgi:hypothetical protein
MPVRVNDVWNRLERDVVHNESANYWPDKVCCVDFEQIFDPGVSDVDIEISQVICATIWVDRYSILSDPLWLIENRI